MIATLIQLFLVDAAIRLKHPKTCFSGLDYSEVLYRVSARWSCETYCPDPAYPRANSLADPVSAPYFVYPPLIHHIRSSSSLTTLLQLIIDETSLPKKYVSELISFGAVYLSVPCSGLLYSAPKRKIPSAVSTENEKLQISTKAEIREKAPNQADLMTRASRVLNEDIPVPFGSYCRVHVNPRRHRAAIDGVNWKQRIVRHRSLDDALETPMLFVDKVAGAPVSSTVDNYHENMVSQVQHILQPNSRPLHLSSRLDTCTSGIVPLARNEIAAAVFSKAIVDRKIGKNYVALCSRNVPLGTLKHCFRKKSKSHDSAKPTLLRAYCAALLLESPSRNLDATVGQQGTTLSSNKKYRKDYNASEKSRNSRSGNQAGSLWQLAELEVLSCRELSLKDLSAEVLSYSSLKLAEPLLSRGKKSSDINDNDSITDLEDGNSGSGLFECEIRLVTGRTHQIRLQLAAIGASILGDTRYNPVEGLLDTTEEDEIIDGLHDGIQEKLKPAKARESKTPSVSTVEVTQVAVGDGSHLMGPEPKRIGLQCRSLFIPAEVALELKYPPSYCKKLMEQYDDDRQVEGDNEDTGNLSDILPSSDDRTTGSFSIDKDGILITAGTPWWLFDRSGR